MTSRRAALMLAAMVWITPALGADANVGKAVFRTQCALCHSGEANDGGGAQGPNLHDVLGRQAASSASFGYTQALQNSNLTWDALTLDRFLAAPTAVVPGSAMVVAVPKTEDRENIIAYFQALKDGTFKGAVRTSSRPRPTTQPPANAGQRKGQADWQQDKPGRVHRINAAKLPAPFDTPSVANSPILIDKPADAKLRVPTGFEVDVFASGLTGPRVMRIAPNGDVFVTETRSGRVTVLRPTSDGTKAATVETFAQGLVQPFGIQFYPAGNQPQWLYVAEQNRIVRYAYKVGDMTASGVPEVVVPQLAPMGEGGHGTRDLVFAQDGRRMFVSVGSQSNVAEAMPKKSPEQIKEWEAQHGLGAAWGSEEKRADVLLFDVDSGGPGKVFATGLRNCVGLTVQPQTGDLWCTTNERDLLGDNLVPDFSTRVKQGGFYGWPWYYMGRYEDPRLKGDRPDLAGKAIVPEVPYQAHSAALTLLFYTATSGSAAFPKKYVGDGFAMLHGSWNRAFRTGYKVVRVRMKHGVPTGEYQDFMTGFIADDGNVWGRPVAATVASDGSLLISDDGGNRVYRIAYTR